MTIPRLMGGIDDNGNLIAIAVNPDGTLKVSANTGDNTTSGRKILFRKVFDDYTLTNSDDFLAVDCSNKAVNITLPTALNSQSVYPISSQIYEIKKVDNSNNFVNILTINSETIDNENSFILNSPHESINLVSDGLNWLVF